MNLTRRPAWMLLAVLLPVVLGGLFVHTWAARDDLLSQLAHRNQDLAEALAVALSQRQSDRSAMTMHAASQFALGHYQALELTGPDGTPWFEQRVDADRQLVPGWFAQLFPLHAEPGQARWGDGARALGQLRVVVRSDRAQEALWSISLRTAALLAL